MQATHILMQLGQKLANPCKYLEDIQDDIELKSGEKEDVKAV